MWGCWGKVSDIFCSDCSQFGAPPSPPLSAVKTEANFNYVGSAYVHVDIEAEREKACLVSVTLPRVDLTTTTRKLRVTSRGVCAWKTRSGG